MIENLKWTRIENLKLRRVQRVWMWPALIGITLLAAGLRFYQLGAQSLWDGEIFTLLFAQYDWMKLLPSVSEFSAHPPLMFILSKIAITWGWNELLLRYPSAFGGILAVPALYALGKRMFDTRVGLLAAALLAISPVGVIFAQNARNYALFVLLVILLLYGGWRAVAYPAIQQATLERNAMASVQVYCRRGWMLFTGVALAGLYLHYLFVLPLSGTVLAMAVLLAWRAWGQQQYRRLGETSLLVLARPLLLSLIVIGTLYLPWLPTVRDSFLLRQLTREERHADDESAALAFDDFPRLLKDLSGHETWGLVLFATLFLIGVVTTWRLRRQTQLLFLTFALFLPIGIMIVLAPRRLPAKYLIYVLPAYLLFTAQGISGLMDWIHQRRRSIDASARRLCRLAPERLGYTVGLGLFAWLALANLPNMPYWNGREHIFTGEGWMVVDEWAPWRQVAEMVRRHARPGDFLLFPDEARELTARSVLPYFDFAFLQQIYNAPPRAVGWWISKRQDVPASNATWRIQETTFEDIVVHHLARPATFQPFALPNGDFEDRLKAWGKFGGLAQWGHDNEAHVEGAGSARVTLLQPREALLLSTPFAVTPGKLFRVTAYVQDPIFGFYTTSPELRVNFYDPNNKQVKRNRLPILIPSTKPGWFLAVDDGIVPPNAVRARVEFVFRAYAYTLGPTSRLDDVRVWLEE